MLNKALSYLSDFFIFFLIFGFFNDNFLVEFLGPLSLKLPVVVLYLLYIPRLLKHFKTMTDTQDKLFFIFWLYSMTLLLIQMLLGFEIDFGPAGTQLIAVLGLMIYFSRYPITKTLYFLWVTMMASVIICYVHPTGIVQWTFRRSGGTEDPNEFATQLLMFFFAFIYLYTRNKSKMFLIVSILFFLYGLFTAGSMSSFLMLGALGLLSLARLVIQKPRLFFNYKILFIFLIALGAATQINPAKIEALNNMLSRTKDTGTAAFRMHSWIAGLHMIEQNPFFGIGVNGFSDNEPLYEEGHMVGSAPAPHNVYIKLLAESGIFSFILFVILIGHIIMTNLKQIYRSDGWYILAMLLSALLMGLTLGFTYDKYFWLPIAILMHLNYNFKRNLPIQ
jgi:O-antigen ligase